jgi:ABC-2 type transport system permease protein
LFTEPPVYYLPGYLATVVLFTPLSRVGSSVARARESNRFEKLATTPLTRADWLVAHTLVNVALVVLAGALILALTVTLTGASVVVGPALLLLPVYLAVATALFAGVGAVLGSLADSQDGVIAASNTLALPLLFLSETFVPPALLPAWFTPALGLSPVTYFSRGVRAVVGAGDPVGPLAGPVTPLGLLAVLAVGTLAAGTLAIPTTD